MRVERHTFGPVLRAARERRGITLKQLAAETKVAAELWAALEDGNLSRWPKQVYARSYVRDYAVRIGLDPDETVNAFCRLFPEWGDRRAEALMRSHAEVVSHELQWEDLPSREQRRASDHAAASAPGILGRHKTRLLAVFVDLKIVFSAAAAGLLLDFDFWPSLAVAAVTYVACGTMLLGRSFGWLAAEWAIKAARAIPAFRRLIASRVEGA
jgi:transcriptional regulator with XRE-family HTH domain